MSFSRAVSKKLGGLRQFGGFQSSLVHIWGDPIASKMAGLEKVLLGMGALANQDVVAIKITRQHSVARAVGF